jgi:hypothetical protein
MSNIPLSVQRFSNKSYHSLQTQAYDKTHSTFKLKNSSEIDNISGTLKSAHEHSNIIIRALSIFCILLSTCIFKLLHRLLFLEKYYSDKINDCVHIFISNIMENIFNEKQI